MTISNEAILEHVIAGYELDEAMVALFIERIVNNTIEPPQVAALLALLRARNLSGNELSYFADAVIKNADPIVRPQYLYGDIVGTGGDGHNTINVSTLASLTVASMGYPIAKHGNVSVSSRCGAADLLRTLGINIDLDADGVEKSLDDNRWCFLFAPRFHPTYRAVKDVRAKLKIKTLFNILGPLVNPMAPPLMIIGVYHESLLMPFAHVLQKLKRQRALIVCGSGLDEIALHGPTHALMMHDGKIDNLVITPQDLGLSSYSLDAVKGGSPEENAAISLAVLSGKASDAQLSFVAASAGALLWLFEHEQSLPSCVKKAYNALKSGEPMAILHKLKESHYGAA